jgi:hypothetical protein
MVNAATCGEHRIEAFIRGAGKVETCSDKEPPETSGKQFEELESLLPASWAVVHIKQVFHHLL